MIVVPRTENERAAFRAQVWELYHLADYIVSSAIGDVRWLIPRA